MYFLFGLDGIFVGHCRRLTSSGWLNGLPLDAAFLTQRIGGKSNNIHTPGGYREVDLAGRTYRLLPNSALHPK